MPAYCSAAIAVLTALHVVLLGVFTAGFDCVCVMRCVPLLDLGHPALVVRVVAAARVCVCFAEACASLLSAHLWSDKQGQIGSLCSGCLVSAVVVGWHSFQAASPRRLWWQELALRHAGGLAGMNLAHSAPQQYPHCRVCLE
jgi:hypothetical protein